MKDFCVDALVTHIVDEGLRLGYVAATQPLMLDRLKKLVRCAVNGMNSITQWGIVMALNGPQDGTCTMAGEYQK